MKVGIIGTGFGQYAVAPVFQKLGFEVDVVSPRDPAEVERVINSKVDLISIHSPPFMHKEHVLMALDRGQNVLCDKPFGRNLADAQVMRDAARKAGVLNFTNFEVRWKPVRAKIKELVDQGVIGKPVHLGWTFYSNGFRTGAHNWVNETAQGGGWINAFASHCIDMIRWMFDSEVVDCGGLTRIEVPRRADREGVERTATAEDAYSAWFRLANGATACQDSAYCASVPMPMRIIVLGDEGGIEVVADTKLTVRRAPKGGENLSAAERIRLGLLAGEGESLEFQPAPGEAHEPSLTPWFTAIRESLRTGKQITTSFEDGYKVAEAMEMLRNNSTRA
jgi:predicted dehydrogenase